VLLSKSLPVGEIVSDPDCVQGTNVTQTSVTDIEVREYVYTTSTVAITFLDMLIVQDKHIFSSRPFFPECAE
jgi:hypothetical protein